MLSKCIVYTFVADRRLCELTYIRDTQDSDYYPYCKDKNYCPLSYQANYMLYIKKRGYIFKGECELECYMKAIYRFYSTRTPLTYPSFPKIKYKNESEE